MQDDTSRFLAELDELIADERRMVRQADFSGLATMASRKEQLLSTLEANAHRSDMVALQRLAGRAVENQKFLASALKGVRAARARVDMVRRAADTLTSYDRMGRSRALEKPSNNHEHRA
jgi:hypothetical protein